MKNTKKIKNPTIADMGTAASTTECTGIVSSAPQTHEGFDNIMETMKFSPKDVPTKKK